MSDNWITIIPEDPNFIPDKARQSRGAHWFSIIAPRADEIQIKVSPKIEFFDCGANLERITCPACQAEIPLDWWHRLMEEGFKDGIELIKIPMPCCGVACTLHELNYDWPQGFGHFALDAMNPGLGELDLAQRHEIEEILGIPVRIIYQHI